ncbi:MAG: polysaccharide deacetylase family protein, partial [Bacteriovoracaceae bacterium]
MKKLLIFTTGTFLLSCSSTDMWKDPTNRYVAGVALEQLMVESPENINEMIDERLHSLHNYYIIGHKNLAAFDKSIADLSAEEIYQSEAYLNLIAVRTQAEEIEHELLDLDKKLSSVKSLKTRKLVKEKIAEFAQSSPMSGLSMQNISFQLGLKTAPQKNLSLHQELPKELEKLEQHKEFLIYEKNIEHIAHTLDTKSIAGRRFQPSVARSGNITGNEFPAKVWSLTFDDGPGRKTTQTILANLQKRKMKASFFQLTSKAQQN